jgi:hypothetical protein
MAAKKSMLGFRISRRDLDSLRHAFAIDEYPVTGRLSGDFHLTGDYERPIGFGGMTIEDGTAYTEPFLKAAATLRFDGKGCAARQRRDDQGHRHGNRRGIYRLGLDVCVQRRRPPFAVGASPVRAVSGCAAHRGSRVQRNRQRHLRHAA